MKRKSSGITFESNQQAAFKWYHGALFLAGISLVEKGLEWLTKKANAVPSSKQEDKDYYKNLRLPFFAPPAKAYPIAWTICDLALIWGNLRVLNKPAATPGRQQYLMLQVGSWGVYSLFTALHFGLRSPVNAFSLTSLFTGLHLASTSIANKQLQDRKVAWAHMPVLGWLSLALPTAATTALWNKDSFYNTKAATVPDNSWLKKDKQEETSKTA